MEVSDFLVHLLTNSRDMSTDGARRVAALWTKGTGQELRSFPPAMYFEIFGKEDGWIVYREVHLALHREKRKELWYTYSHRGYSPMWSMRGERSRLTQYFYSRRTRHCVVRRSYCDMHHHRRS